MSERGAARLAGVRGFLFDMDGTLYVGPRAMPGAVELMRAVAEAGRPRLVLTNNSSRARERYRRRLAELGMPVRRDEVLTSGAASAAWLAAHTPHRRPFVLGTAALVAECRRAGLTPTAAADGPDCVLLGYDTTLNYRRLTDACLLVARDLPYYATHADRTCIDPRGLLPDAGAFIAAIETTTGRRPIILGKPERGMAEAGLGRLGTAAHETLILGDQLDTDMTMGVRFGLVAVLTLTGETTPAHLERSDVRPDLVVRDPGELLAHLRAAGALPAPPDARRAGANGPLRDAADRETMEGGESTSNP